MVLMMLCGVVWCGVMWRGTYIWFWFAVSSSHAMNIVTVDLMIFVETRYYATKWISMAPSIRGMMTTTFFLGVP